MPEPNAEKVVFDAAQQKKVDELIRESMGRAGNEARATAARLETEMITLRSELAAAKETAKADAEGRAGLESSLTVREKEAKAARDETIAVKKQNAIQAAATEHNFFNPGVVSKLTEDKIQWNADKQKFIVLGDDGSERLGVDGNSLTVSAFLKEFGVSNSYIVRGDVTTGVGSAENARPYSPQTETQKLKAIFGKGSDGRLANETAMRNPQLYK